MAKYTIEIEDAAGGVRVTATGGADKGEESPAQGLVVAILLSARTLQKVGEDMVKQGVVVPATRKPNVY